MSFWNDIFCFKFILDEWAFYNTSYGLLASFFVAINAILIKKYLAVVQNNVLKFVFYNNLNATLLFVPLFLYSGEFDEIVDYQPIYFDNRDDKHQGFIFTLVASSFASFFLAYITVLLLKVTSPLTFHINWAIEACTLMFLIKLVFNSAKAPGFSFVGAGLMITGGLLYSEQDPEDSASNVKLKYVPI